ncbi:MAG: phospho-N-acetylmuramoyl-pentapeptide-transferase [Pyrinomonadaceae bacterium]|jgi:phospho-N-acetylmuramoyl-pentapeptide-transferase|nr:phospho-N-acetylmuramoyl-pentapeptide-transferase [Pyrinomonadaceae bacterium]MDQ1589680.1 phospho-N-acetylmuramoyl-pentapeptide-transferase [Pyrinomonadaceae bacterium]
MIYYIFYHLIFERNGGQNAQSVFIKALNVFQYVTFRTAYATVTALLISLVFGGRVIRALREMNVGQQIREEGPQAHMAKRGTPTMGGVLIIGSVLISTLLWARLSNLYVWIVLLSTALFAVVGFLDDYAKVAKRQSLGLTGKQKLAAQFLIAIGVWATLYFFSPDYSWNLSFPFFKQTDTSMITYIGPWLYLAFIVVVLTGASNAVNLTDGLDGLAISVTFIAMVALTAFTYVSGDERWAKQLFIDHRREVGELTVFCGAMAGASLGFLWYNAPPADVFMGDVGSLAIGGAIGTIGILTKQEFILVLVGGVFVLEAISVMLQVSFFKMTKRHTGTGRRLFKMTPLHHHFEMQGWKESKVVFRFLILAILFALLSLSTLKLR